jgi:hypothetical protein
VSAASGGEQRARITGRGIGPARNGLPSDMLPSGRYAYGRSKPELRPAVPPSGTWRPPRRKRPLYAPPSPAAVMPDDAATPPPARAPAREEAPAPARTPPAAGLAPLPEKPPVTSQDELEAADCDQCKGAKAGPSGEAEAAGQEHRAVPAPKWCPRCQYLLTAPGHKLTCGGTP